MSLETWRKAVDKMVAKLAATGERVRTERTSYDALEARVAVLEEAQTLAQAVAQQIQTIAHKRIAEIVTSCLAIFEEPYVFRIHFDRKRGKTDARLVFERDGLEVDPLTASGGGVVDVAAFALRVACLVMRKPSLRRLLVLDEPFKFVSVEYRPRVRRMLEKLATDLHIQIVMVTHDPRLLPRPSVKGGVVSHRGVVRLD